MSSPRRLHAVQGRVAVDLVAAETAAHGLLEALGADLDHVGLRETPRRIAQAYVALLTPMPLQRHDLPE